MPAWSERGVDVQGYDSDDPYEKLAFASGTHACYEPSDEDVNGSYLPVKAGEAAPELNSLVNIYESAFEAASKTSAAKCSRSSVSTGPWL